MEKTTTNKYFTTVISESITSNIKHQINMVHVCDKSKAM